MFETRTSRVAERRRSRAGPLQQGPRDPLPPARCATAMVLTSSCSVAEHVAGAEGHDLPVVAGHPELRDRRLHHHVEGVGRPRIAEGLGLERQGSRRVPSADGWSSRSISTAGGSACSRTRAPVARDLGVRPADVDRDDRVRQHRTLRDAARRCARSPPPGAARVPATRSLSSMPRLISSR